MMSRSSEIRHSLSGQLSSLALISNQSNREFKAVKENKIKLDKIKTK